MTIFLLGVMLFCLCGPAFFLGTGGSTRLRSTKPKGLVQRYDIKELFSFNSHCPFLRQFGAQRPGPLPPPPGGGLFFYQMAYLRLSMGISGALVGK